MRRLVTAFCLLLAAVPGGAAAETSDAEAALIGAVVGQAISAKTTLGDGAGEIEGWMINARLLESAAAAIAADETVNVASPGVILIGDEAPNLALPGRVLLQARQFRAAWDEACPPTPASTGPRFLNSAIVSALATAIGDAPASGITYTGYTLASDDQALVTALQHQLGPKWARLDDALAVDAGSNVLQQWEMVRASRYAAAVRCPKSDDVKALAQRFDALDTRLSNPGEKGEPSLLDQAARIENAFPPGASLLRVHIVKAGGSITNSDNIFTRLGVPAVRVTGAVVVGYRLIDAATGRAAKAGLIVCRTPRKTLGAIHKGELPSVDAQNCTVAD